MTINASCRYANNIKKMEAIGNLSELLKEHYFKSVRVNSFYSNNYIAYESNGDKNKTLPPEERLE